MKVFQLQLNSDYMFNNSGSPNTKETLGLLVFGSSSAKEMEYNKENFSLELLKASQSIRTFEYNLCPYC